MASPPRRRRSWRRCTATSRRSMSSSARRAPGSSPAAWSLPASPPWCGCATARCSPPTAPSPRPRSSSADSGSSRPPTWMRHWRGRRGRRKPAVARSRCARSRTVPLARRIQAADMTQPSFDASAIGDVFREEYGRAVATLVRLLGDIELAEEAVQDAFVVAVQKWPEAGLPPNPGGWIVTTARRRAIDRLRREATRADRHAQAAALYERDDQPEVSPVQDDRLRL